MMTKNGGEIKILQVVEKHGSEPVRVYGLCTYPGNRNTPKSIVSGYYETCGNGFWARVEQAG